MASWNKIGMEITGMKWLGIFSTKITVTTPITPQKRFFLFQFHKRRQKLQQ
jgi:hypothetical protein